MENLFDQSLVVIRCREGEGREVGRECFKISYDTDEGLIKGMVK
jgi:hypothetical protein